MRFVTRPPPSVLHTVIRELWLLEDDGAMSAGLPKPYVELVVSLSGVHWWRAAPDAVEHRYAESWLTPVQDGPRYARADGPRRLMGARLEPWLASALFGPLPPGDGRPPPCLDLLIGDEAAALRRTLMVAPNEPAAFEHFASWLETHVSTKAAAISFCVDTLSARTTRRRYAREMGISPKRWQLLHRLDSLLRDPDLGAKTKPLALLAQEHGFADQAHMSREMKRLTGASPGGLRRRDHRGPPHLVRQD